MSFVFIKQVKTAVIRHGGFSEAMFAIYFEWRVKRGQEEEFERLWSLGTEALREAGSLGSALFKSASGRYHGFARWPDKQTRDVIFTPNFRTDIFLPFAETIDEMVVREEMELVESQWVL
jgi:hypothetical protein